MKARTIQSALRASLNVVVLFMLLLALAPTSWAGSCAGLPTAAQLKTFLGQAASGSEPGHDPLRLSAPHEHRAEGLQQRALRQSHGHQAARAGAVHS